MLLSGDHVLPTITPHIWGIGAGVDPLQRFFDSLARMHELDGVTMVLPAHGQPFNDLDGRVDAIRDHHLERLDKLRQAGRDLDGGTVEEFSQRLFAERRGVRWPRARPTPTSSTCASRTRPSGGKRTISSAIAWVRKPSKTDARRAKRKEK